MELRRHQQELAEICEEILGGRGLTDIVCAVTPGGGKSLLPQILAARLIPAIADALCWIVPRSVLQDQGARGFQDPSHRALLGHRLEAMMTTNQEHPTRGCAAYVTTYQALAADTRKINAKEFRRKRYLLVLDEPHHIEEGGIWHEAIQPLYDRAVLRVLMSGTFERGEGTPIAFLPYTTTDQGDRIDWDSTESRAVIRYTLADALREHACIDLTVQYANCQATWLDAQGVQHHVESLAHAGKQTAAALLTALKTEAALELLSTGVKDWQVHRTTHPRSKLLVVAANIEQAQKYTVWLQDLGVPARIATSDDSTAAYQAIKAFKRQGSGAVDCLITVAMAYEGLDVPAMTHLICLTHIRTKPWIEQVVHRATRMDPLAEPYAEQRAYIYAPDDRPFRECLEYILAQRNTAIANTTSSTQAHGEEAYPNGPGLLPMTDRVESSIQPLRSGVLGMRNQGLWANLAMPVQAETHQETPKERLDRLRKQIERHVRAHEQSRRLAHGTVNRAVFSQFRKSRAAMTESELHKVMNWVNKIYPL
jgi:superfamily II DNA or RNA helicase